MATLADTQRAVRDAVVLGIAEPARPLLAGGADPVWRLGIHRRHYRASLIDAIRHRYPATAWLIGDAAVTAAATRYVSSHPPRHVCIAEFGADFPPFLAAEASVPGVPYLEEFARLEWHAGVVSVSVDGPALRLADLAAVDAGTLVSSGLRLQPGLVYLKSDWPVDELLRLYLSDRIPPRFHMEPEATFVEVRGARGSLHITRIEPAAWCFRQRLQAGDAMSTAAERALDVHARFDPGRALIDLCDAGLVAARA